MLVEERIGGTDCSDANTLCVLRGAHPREKTVLRSIVRQNRDGVLACYQKRRAVDRTAAGIVETNFTIELDGSVMHASAMGIHPDVESCIVEVIRSIKFPL